MKKRFLSLFLIIVLAALPLLSGCGGGNDSGASTENEPVDSKKMTESYIDMLFSQKDYEKAYNDFQYSDELYKALSSDILQDFAKQIIDKCGEFKEIKENKETSGEDYKTYQLECLAENSGFICYLSVSAENKITGIDFSPRINTTAAEAGEKLMIGAEGFELPGVLLAPDSGTAEDLVIILHGAGASDLNGTMGRNQPYKDIAEQLKAKGVASYRFDKRSYFYSGSIDISTFTPYEETIQDAIAIFKFFSENQSYNFNKIYFLGHSQGGYFLPKIIDVMAEEGIDSNKLGGLIFAGANADPIENINVAHIKKIIEESDMLSAEEKASELTKAVDARENIKKIKSGDDTENYSPDQLLGASKNYYLYLKDYDPAVSAENIYLPMLFIYGENDKNVPAEQMDIWKNNITGGLVSYKTYPQLNHLLIPGTGWLKKDTLEKNTVSADVTKDIADWIISLH